MPKLPPNYVKAPSTKATKKKGAAAAPVGSKESPGGPEAAPTGRGKLSTVEPLSAAATREVLVHLTEAQHHALQVACEEQRLQGEAVTVEAMVQRVISGWMAQAFDLRAGPAKPTETGVLAHLIRFAESPVQRWRELGMALRRLSSAALRTAQR